MNSRCTGLRGKKKGYSLEIDNLLQFELTLNNSLKRFGSGKNNFLLSLTLKILLIQSYIIVRIFLIGWSFLYSIHPYYLITRLNNKA